MVVSLFHGLKSYVSYKLGSLLPKMFPYNLVDQREGFVNLS